MKKYRSRGIYRILRYMSRKGRYPNGTLRPELEGRFDPDVIDELCYYDYLEKLGAGRVRITVKGREALRLHVLTVVNVLLVLLTLIVAVIALFL